MSVLVNGAASWKMRLADPRGFLDQVVAFGTGLAVCTDGSRGAFAVSATEGRWAVDAVAVTDRGGSLRRPSGGMGLVPWTQSSARAAEPDEEASDA